MRQQLPLRMSWLYQESVLESTFYDDELEALWLPLLNRLRTPIEQALRDSRLKPGKLTAGAGRRRVTDAAGATHRGALIR